MRDITERVKAAAPFLTFDGDPYPVITDGRLVWVFDGYTTSDNYPYSQSQTPDEGGASGKSFNYVRNSVKATVDAYDGTIKFYVVDPTDPIIKAYRAAFPDLFSDFSQMDKDYPGLRAHLRYPQDLFRYQTDVVPQVPHDEPDDVLQRHLVLGGLGRSRPSAGATNDVSHDHRTRRRTRRRRASGSSRSTSSHAAGADQRGVPHPAAVRAGLEGQQPEPARVVHGRAAPIPSAAPRLESLEMPTGLTVAGPVQVNRTINNTAAISKEFSLLNQQGSRVVQGSIQIIPVKDSLLYIQPIYVLSENGQQPAFRDVIVYYNGSAAIDRTADRRARTSSRRSTASRRAPATAPARAPRRSRR